MNNRRFYAPCIHGLEQVLATEIKSLGGQEVHGVRGGVHFVGELELGYRACLWLRSAIRVQEEIVVGEATSKSELYDVVRSVAWQEFMDVEQTLAVDGAIRDSFAKDPRTPALLVKDAIVDQFRERCGQRPSVDRRHPILPLRVVLIKNKVRLYRDFSGESLHKRGYRPIQVKSPLNESVAAGLLLLSGWDRCSPLIDPMCGSGTLLIEAAFLAGDRAPGLHREFPFDLWPDFDDHAWHVMIEDAERRAQAGRGQIPVLIGADRHAGALALAKDAAHRAGVADHVEWQECSVAELQVFGHPGATVVVNPPYGERLGQGEDLVRSWQDLGTFLHDQCEAEQAFVLSGDPELTRRLRLRADRKWPVKNGPIDCRWVRYVLRSKD